MDSDIIIIGGGPSGLMAAVAAGQNGASVLLIDKGDKLGRKLAISGGGRCNVTNAMETDQLIRHIPGNGRFLYSAFAEFGNRDIIAFFEGLGIPLKEEDRGRMFPVSDKAKTVVDALVKEVRRLGVRIRTNSPVKELLIRDGKAEGVLLHGGETLRSRAVIVATGGKSVPHTGSTGDAYPWAIAAGHTVTDLYPTEVPLTSSETFIRSRTLQGLSLRDIELTVWNPKGKKIITHDGDLLFTHFGLSGPTALRCSQFVVKTLKKFDVRTVLLTIDLLPDRTENAVTDEARSRAAGEPKKHIRNTLKGMLPERLIPVVLDKAGIAEDALFDHISKSSWARLAEVIKRFPVEIDGTLSIEEAFVTGGGVSLKEIDPRTMASRIVQGLYFCGEVLDIHGYTGGYNITAAFVTGHAAGRSAARQTREEREKREAPADDSV